MTGPIFERLICFVDDKGNIQYGDVPKDMPISQIEDTYVTVLSGSISEGFNRTDSVKQVKKVLYVPPITNAPSS